MKSDRIRRAIGGIDDDIIEAADSGKTDIYRPIRTRWVSVAAVFVLLLSGAFVLPGILKQSDPAKDPGTRSTMTGGEGTKTQGGAAVPDGSGDGRGTAGVMIPTGPATNELSFAGEEITDGEAAAYFDANRESLFGAFRAEGIAMSDVRISDHGYCHIQYDGTPEKGLEVIRNSRDYLVYSGDRLAAILTLAKENGALRHSLEFSSAGYEEYDEYLNVHKGQELIYLYAGSMEIVLAPDGDNINPLGSDIAGYLSWVKDPYEWFYSKDVVFIP